MAAMTSAVRLRAALAATALALLAGCGSDSTDDSASTSTTAAPTTATSGTSTTPAAGPELGPAFPAMTSLPGALRTAPPWPANNGPELERRLRAIGLDPLTEEGQVVHIHEHLDLYVDGRKVTVPANVGIDARQAFISDLHTHEIDGIVHVESPTPQSFSVGQFFAIWGLPLSATCIGSLCEQGAKALRVWVGGRPVGADPTRIVLAEHQEIVIAYGTDAQVPDPVPASFDWAKAGL